MLFFYIPVLWVNRTRCAVGETDTDIHWERYEVHLLSRW